MKHAHALVPVLTLALTACVATAPQAQELATPPSGPHVRSPFSMQVNVGVRDHHGDSWQGLDSQGVLDVFGVYAPEAWPLALELGVSFASDRGKFNGDRRDVSTLEILLGVRKELPLTERVSLAVGAGGFAANTSDSDRDGWFDSDEIDDDGWGGLYAHGGVYVELDEELRLGIDARFSAASDPHVDGSDRNGDSSQVALSAIFGF